MKTETERDHTVPLSPRALAILEEMKGLDPVFIFAGSRPGKSISSGTMSAVLKRMGSDVTVHGFRSTFKDWAAEMTEFENFVSEMALAHTIPDAVEAAYRRGDLLRKRKLLMDAWATYCATPPAGKVVPFQKQAS